jgi:hypothetical protein
LLLEDICVREIKPRILTRPSLVRPFDFTAKGVRRDMINAIKPLMLEQGKIEACCDHTIHKFSASQTAHGRVTTRALFVTAKRNTRLLWRRHST